MKKLLVLVTKNLAAAVNYDMANSEDSIGIERE
jgi:hypothetical protein